MTPAELHAYIAARWTEYRRGQIITLDALDSDGTQLSRISRPVPMFNIAVCDAALRRLARHTPVVTRASTTCNAAWPIHNPAWPCPEVLDDAAPFANRPDFPEELKHDQTSR